jgi:hypothetical protein
LVILDEIFFNTCGGNTNLPISFIPSLLIATKLTSPQS